MPQTCELLDRLEIAERGFMRKHLPIAPNTLYLGYNEYDQFRALPFPIHGSPKHFPETLGPYTVVRVAESAYFSLAYVAK